jgi:hypothetical protein
MLSLLMFKYTIVEGNEFVVVASLMMAFSTLFCATFCVYGWGIDIHKHLEEQGLAYDELHPDERAEQLRREATGTRPAGDL